MKWKPDEDAAVAREIRCEVHAAVAVADVLQKGDVSSIVFASTCPCEMRKTKKMPFFYSKMSSNNLRNRQREKEAEKCM